MGNKRHQLLYEQKGGKVVRHLVEQDDDFNEKDLDHLMWLEDKINKAVLKEKKQSTIDTFFRPRALNFD